MSANWPVKRRKQPQDKEYTEEGLPCQRWERCREGVGGGTRGLSFG